MADLDFTIKDSTGTTKTFRGTDDGTGKIIPIHEISAGEAHVGQVGGKVLKDYNSFNRPADTIPYTAGDRVSASTGASTPTIINSLSRISGQNGYIVGAKLSTNKKSIIPRFRVHLYTDSAPTLAVDNVAYKSIFADDTIHLGWFDLPAMTTPTDTTNSDLSTAQDFAMRTPFITVFGVDDIWFALEALDGFTPASGETFQLTLFGDLN